MRMLRTERLLIQRQGPFQYRLRDLVIARIVQYQTQMVEISCDLRMFGPETRRVQDPRTFKQRRRVAKIAEIVSQSAEIAQIVGECWVIGSEFTLALLQHALELGAGGSQVLGRFHAPSIRPDHPRCKASAPFRSGTCLPPVALPHPGA